MKSEIMKAFYALSAEIKKHGLEATVLLVPWNAEITALCSINGTNLANAMTSAEIATISMDCQKKRHGA